MRVRIGTGEHQDLHDSGRLKLLEGGLCQSVHPKRLVAIHSACGMTSFLLVLFELGNRACHVENSFQTLSPWVRVVRSSHGLRPCLPGWTANRLLSPKPWRKTCVGRPYRCRGSPPSFHGLLIGPVPGHTMHTLVSSPFSLLEECIRQVPCQPLCGIACRGFPYNFSSTVPTFRSLTVRYHSARFFGSHRGDGKEVWREEHEHRQPYPATD